MRVQVSLFGDVSNHALKAGKILVDAPASIKNLSVRRLDQASEHLYRSALSRAIRTEISKDLSRSDGEANLADRSDVAVVLGEIARFEHVSLLRGYDTGERQFVSEGKLTLTVSALAGPRVRSSATATINLPLWLIVFI